MNYQKQLIFESDLAYVGKQLVGLFILQVAIFFITLSNKFENVVDYSYYGYTVSVTVCGSEIMITVVNRVIEIILNILASFFIYKLAMTKIDWETRLEYLSYDVTIFLDFAMILCHFFIPKEKIIPYIAYSVCDMVRLIATYYYYGAFKYVKKGFVDEKIKMKQMSAYYQILEEPITRAYLKLFMKTLLQEESILFWEEVSEYKSYVDRKRPGVKFTKGEMQKRADNIYNVYIKDGSEYEVNISAAMKKEIAVQLPDATPTIFDVAFNEVTQLIIFNNAVPYCVSPQAKSANQLLKWFQTYSTLEPELQQGIKEKILESLPH